MANLLLSMALLFAACAACGQSYPVRPVRLIVPLSTGSASDALARALARAAGDAWGQQVVVENMPGANGIIGTKIDMGG